MANYSTHIKEYPVYTQNPIVVTGIKQKKIIGKLRELGTDTETGERIIIERAAPSKIVLIDENKKISLYNDELADVLPSISTSGLFVLSYVLKNLPKDKDTVLLYPNALMEFFKHKTTTVFYRGISDLLAHNVLFRKQHTSNEYFINVSMFYHGDRTKLYNNGGI